MKNTNKLLLIGSFLLVVLVSTFVRVNAGTIELDEPTRVDHVRHYNFFTATTTSVTSNVGIETTFDALGRIDDGTLDLRGAKKATFYFGRGDTTGTGNSGNSVFSLEVTPDGSNWYDFNRLIANDVSATATSSVTLTATTTQAYALDLTYDTFKAVRCVVVETTDGEHTCEATVEY